MKRTIKILVAAGALGAMCLCGTMFAYLTDADAGGTQTFTVGKVEGSLTGAPDENLTIIPLQSVSAAPKVSVASGSADAIVFIEFECPKDTLVVCDSSGNKGTEALQDVFTTGTIDTTNWIRLTGVTGTDGTSAVYGYKTKMSAGSETESLFSNMTFVNATEAASGNTYTVTLKADLIQADNLGVTTSGNLSEENLKSIYTKFFNQNKV